MLAQAESGSKFGSCGAGQSLEVWTRHISKYFVQIVLGGKKTVQDIEWEFGGICV